MRGFRQRTLRATTNPTRHPHARVKMQIARIAGFHVHVQAKGIQLRVHIIRLRGILEFLQNLPRPHAPPIRLHRNKGGGMIVRLQQIVGVDMGGQVGRDQLRVLAPGLRRVMLSDEKEQMSFQQRRTLTTTVPFPHRPFQCPEI